jgi:hypothetical protein
MMKFCNVLFGFCFVSEDGIIQVMKYVTERNVPVNELRNDCCIFCCQPESNRGEAF